MHVYGVQCAPSLFHRQPIIFTLKDIVVTPNKPLILLWWSMLYYSLGVHCAIVVCDLVRSICSVSASLICLLHMIVCQTWAKGYPIGISISFSFSLSAFIYTVIHMMQYARTLLTGASSSRICLSGCARVIDFTMPSTVHIDWRSTCTRIVVVDRKMGCI